MRRASAFAAVACLVSACGTEGETAPRDAGQPAERSAERGPVRMVVRADRRTISVGDKLTLTVEVEAPHGVVVEMPRVADTIGPFMVRDRRTPPDVPEGETRRWTHAYVLDTFDAGEAEIPALEASFVDRRPEAAGPDGAPVETKFATEPLAVQVRTVLAANEGEADYRDIRPPAPVPIARGLDLRLLAGAAILLALVGGLLFVMLRRRARAQAAATSEPPLSPDLWALRELDALAAGRLVEQGRFHEYYFRLSDIVRQYVERRFGLCAPERTTEEFLRDAAASSALGGADRELLAGFLRAADMVKFALHEPSSDEGRSAFASALGFVERTGAAAAAWEGAAA